jgi:phosphatidylglycerol:prolipoprotein diacylglycerol transferase
MAFHGGLLGALAGMWVFARKNSAGFFQVSDFIAPYVPIGLFMGRMGNFINGELWGKPTDLPWGMVFPGAGPEPRHPSQLYEAALEGVALYFLLRWVAHQLPPRQVTSGLFLVAYALFRFAIEFVRLPDAHIGYLAFGWLTMGQVLCIPMFLYGVYLIWSGYRARSYARSAANTP